MDEVELELDKVMDSDKEEFDKIHRYSSVPGEIDNVEVEVYIKENEIAISMIEINGTFLGLSEMHDENRRGLKKWLRKQHGFDVDIYYMEN